MSQCALSPHEFVQDAFNPRVAVASSAKAEAACRLNNLSFVDMIQPFCKLNTEAHLRDPLNQSFLIRNLRIVLCDVTTSEPTPKSNAVVRKLLHDVVASTVPNDQARMTTVTGSGYTIQINSSTPWFEAYRDCLLKMAPSTDHEFLNHFLACVFVVAAHETEPLQEFSRLSQQHGTDKTAKWFFPVTLRHYVLLHDVAECEQTKAEAVFRSVQTTYGQPSCFLLQINSRRNGPEDVEENQLPDPWSQFLTRKPSPEISEGSRMELTVEQNGENDKRESPERVLGFVEHPLMPETEPFSDGTVVLRNGDGNDDDTVDVLPERFQPEVNDYTEPCQHGAFLTLADVEQIRVFVQEFCFKALLPFVEKQLGSLHETVSNRKGLHRSFFSATKKWFGSNRAAPSNVASSFVVYGPEAVELQVRRLGDLAFMFQNYELAYHAYHGLKRDFSADQAWMHFAGAGEMAAVSVFMQAGTVRQVPIHYFDSAINAYLQTCKSLHFATRSTLLATECLKHQARHLEAAAYYIRLTSEESDLRSALLLEQAAHCFAGPPGTVPYVRKYAFYLILAGHRFNKAGQKRHSLRCYQQALQVYEDRKWCFAEDHINLVTGRLSFGLNRAEDALRCFRRLLYDGSQQCDAQQTYYVREYFAICNFLAQSSDGHLPELPLPLVDAQNCKVWFGTVDASSETGTEEAVWNGLEERAVIVANGTVPHGYKPLPQFCDSGTDNTQPPSTVVDEPVTVELVLRNPLRVPLALSNIRLLWKFRADVDSNWADAVQPGTVDSVPVESVLIEPLESRTVGLVLVPRQLGQVGIGGLAYGLTSSGTDDGTVSTFCVTGTQPLRVTGPRVPNVKDGLSGTVQKADQRLEPLIVPSMPRLIVTVSEHPGTVLCGQVFPVRFELSNEGRVALRNVLLATSHPEHVVVTTEPNRTGVVSVPFPDDRDVLEPRARFQIPAWIRGPDTSGQHTISVLFYYEAVGTDRMFRHRTCRARIRFQARSVLTVTGVALSASKPIQLEPNLVVAVEIANCTAMDTSGMRLRLMWICCASRKWTLEPIKRAGQACHTVIGPKETVHLCFRAVERFSEAEHCFSTVPFDGPDSVDCGTVPYCDDFLCRAVDGAKLSLAIFWEATGPDQLAISGQHHLHIGNDDVIVSTVSEPTKAIDNRSAFRHNKSTASTVLKYFLFAESTVRHDFGSSSTLTVPVILVLYNRTELDLIVVIQLSKNREACQEAGRFLWVGGTRFKVRLAPNETRLVRLRACFFRTGTYVLDGLTVGTEPDLAESHVCQSGSGHIVIVDAA